MATLNLSYNTGSVTLSDLNDTLAFEWGYRANIPDPQNPEQTIPNPESKADFNKRLIGMHIKNAYRQGKRRPILDNAEASVPDITIT